MMVFLLAGGVGPARAGEPTWSPVDLGGELALWLDANAVGTLTTNASGRVSVWRDKSSYGRHAVQATAGYQPRYVASASHGKPALYFQASRLDHLDGPFTNSMTQHSIFGVYRRAGVVTNIYNNLSYIFGIARDGVDTRLHLLGWNNFALASSIQKSTVELYAPRSDSWNVHAVMAPLGTAIPATYRFSGGRTVRTADVSGVSGIADAMVYRLGGATWVIGVPMNGYWSELIVVSHAVTEATALEIEGYLAHKWGLEAKLPSSHPYAAEPGRRSSPLWTPMDATQAPVLWLDADDTATLTTNASGRVSEWRDKTGMENHARSINSVADPVSLISDILGKRVLRFGEVAGTPTTTYLQTDALGVFDEASVFILYKRSGSCVNVWNNTTFALSGGGDYAQATNRTFQIAYTDAAYAGGPGFISYVWESGVVARSHSYARNDNFNIHYLGWRYPDSLAVALNGSTPYTASLGLRNRNLTHVRVGNATHDTGLGLKGDIGEVVVYDRFLTAGEQQKVEGYLAHKWGLSLVAGHPYEHAPPVVTARGTVLVFY